MEIWILSLTNRLIVEATEALDSYDTVSAITKIQDFVNDLSTWYIRRSRDRVGHSAEDDTDKKLFYETTFAVLATLSKLFSPIAPFISEEIFKNLTGKDSVHLADWPDYDSSLIDEDLENEMETGRGLVSQVHMMRKTNDVPIKIPLKAMSYSGPNQLSEEILNVLKSEMNVQDLKFDKKVNSNTVKRNIDLKNKIEFGGKKKGIFFFNFFFRHFFFNRF